MEKHLNFFIKLDVPAEDKWISMVNPMVFVYFLCMNFLPLRNLWWWGCLSLGYKLSFINVHLFNQTLNFLELYLCFDFPFEPFRVLMSGYLGNTGRHLMRGCGPRWPGKHDQHGEAHPIYQWKLIFNLNNHMYLFISIFVFPITIIEILPLRLFFLFF